MVTVRRELSPNHLDKRRRILDAAETVLLEGGPSSCTARAIAQESGLTPGLIHYYFDTVDEIVDTAMADLLAELTGRIRTAAEAHDDPEERLWSVVREHLSAFADRPGMTLLWFDWFVSATRRGRADSTAETHDHLVDLYRDLLAEVGVPDPKVRARALLAYVTGVIVRRQIHPGRVSRLRAELNSLIGTDGPVPI